jgi:hypothetical protein
MCAAYAYYAQLARPPSTFTILVLVNVFGPSELGLSTRREEQLIELAVDLYSDSVVATKSKSTKISASMGLRNIIDPGFGGPMMHLDPDHINIAWRLGSIDRRVHSALSNWHKSPWC